MLPPKNNMVHFEIGNELYALDVAKEQAYRVSDKDGSRNYVEIDRQSLPPEMQKHYETMYKWNQWVSRRSKMFEGI